MEVVVRRDLSLIALQGYHDYEQYYMIVQNIVLIFILISASTAIDEFPQTQLHK